MASRALPQSRLRARRRKRRIFFALIAALSLFVLLGASVGASWLPWFRITTIEVSGAASINTQNVEKTVRETLSGTYFYIFARDNIFLYPREEIRNNLAQEFSALKRVEIGGDNLTTLLIKITEREAGALWCGSSPASPSPCYLLDSEGAVYAPAADFGGEIYTQYYGPTSGGVPQQYITPDQFHSLSAVVSALRDLISTDTLVSVEVRGNDVHATFRSGFILMFSLADDTANVLERFNLALTAEPFSTHVLSDFEYLDLRFGDKLYYKLR